MSESQKYLRTIIDSKKKRLEDIEAKIMHSEDRLRDQEARRLKLIDEIRGLERSMAG